MENRPRPKPRPIPEGDASSPRFSHQAKNRWEGIPEEFRQRVLANVWCGKCAAGTTIVNFRGTIDGGDLILRGFCSRCGAEVARHIESS
jgi:hypothetical protein